MHTKNVSQKLVGEVQMFRIRVATAESKVKLLRDQARQAKRRRKEAKRLAQRARKQFKQFKAELAEMRQALAKAETNLFQAGGRAMARKTAKARLVANRGALPSKKSKAAVRKPRLRSAWPREFRVPGRSTRKKPATTEAKVVSDGAAQVAALERTPSTPQIPGTNS